MDLYRRIRKTYHCLPACRGTPRAGNIPVSWRLLRQQGLPQQWHWHKADTDCRTVCKRCRYPIYGSACWKFKYICPQIIWTIRIWDYAGWRNPIQNEKVAYIESGLFKVSSFDIEVKKNFRLDWFYFLIQSHIWQK